MSAGEREGQWMGGVGGLPPNGDGKGMGVGGRRGLIQGVARPKRAWEMGVSERKSGGGGNSSAETAPPTTSAGSSTTTRTTGTSSHTTLSSSLRLGRSQPILSLGLTRSDLAPVEMAKLRRRRSWRCRCHGGLSHCLVKTGREHGGVEQVQLPSKLGDA
jgi:hypothetical protein